MSLNNPGVLLSSPIPGFAALNVLVPHQVHVSHVLIGIDPELKQ